MFVCARAHACSVYAGEHVYYSPPFLLPSILLSECCFPPTHRACRHVPHHHPLPHLYKKFPSCSFRSPFICHSYVSTPACRVRTSFYSYRRLPAHLAGHSATKNISIQSATYKVCIKYHTCISPLVKDPSERADDRKGGSAPTWQHKSETLSPGGQ